MVLRCNCYIIPSIYLHNITDCGGFKTLDSMNSTLTLTSPYYPAPYPSMMMCRWVIRSPESSTMLVTNHDMRIAPRNDHLHIVDGTDWNGRTIATFNSDSNNEGWCLQMVYTELLTDNLGYNLLMMFQEEYI